MKIEKTQGVQSANELTCARLQEIILGYKQQCPISKVIIDAEKITCYKFGLKMGVARHAANGIIYNNGNLSYEGLASWGFPMIEDTTMYKQLLVLFNLL